MPLLKVVCCLRTIAALHSMEPVQVEYATKRIHLIRRRSYYLFRSSILCSFYSRATTIQERKLFESGVYFTRTIPSLT